MIFLIGKYYKEFPIIDSTNSFIKRHIKNLPNGYIAFTTNQISGYGSKGRTWTNFKNESLAISVLFKNVNNQFLNLSTRLACVCALNALKDLKIENVKIKWFNDLLILNKKIAGALGETQIYEEKIHCVLGLGINLLQKTSSFKQYNLPNAGSVLSTTKKIIQPKIFLKSYIKNLNYFAFQYQKESFYTTEKIQNVYLKNCNTIGKHLKIINNSNQRCFFGIAKQILKNGNLLVQTNNKNLIELTPNLFSIVHI